MKFTEALKLVWKEDAATLKLLFETHKDFFTTLVDAENKSNPTFKDLQYALTDLNGKKYFKFPDGLALPIERIGKLQDFQMYIKTGMDADEWKRAVDNIELICHKGLDNPSAGGALIAEIKIIKEMLGKVFHTELLYNMAAVQLIREDESIITYNNDIQLEKVKQFKLEAEKAGSFFFFHLTDLKTLRNYLELSPAEWTSLWLQSEQNTQVLKEQMNYLREKLKALRPASSNNGQNLKTT